MSESESPRRRKVLVVDDQPILGRAIRRMLADHEVTSVGSAREALDRIEAGERYDVIISDLMMPELSGMDLHDKLLEIAPEQVPKMVFMTGGAFTDRSRAFFEKVDNPTIEKPFDKKDLLALLDGLLR